MPSIESVKELAVTQTPLVLFDCKLADGTMERWSTHRVSHGGHTYEARVARHNAFDTRWGAEDGIDSVARVALTLINADSYFSQIERSPGFKGAGLTATFVFFDLAAGAAASSSTVLFRGMLGGAEEIAEASMRISATNRMNPQRLMLPDLRIQRRCPWSFPSTETRRAEAIDGGERGKYSSFWRCGYSADQAGGLGNLDGAAPFTSCDYTRSACEQRGMFDRDSANRVTRRFGGVEFVPASTLVRGHGEKDFRAGTLSENEARYNDFVPVVYGTAWLNPPVVFARNDGNLTRTEVLLGAGEIHRVLKVVVNGFEVPQGVAGQNMTGTGWFNLVSAGAEAGGFNLDFSGGDPYGSMAFLSVVIPNRVADGKAVPKVNVLLEGLKLPAFGADGSHLGEAFTNNPAWVMLDLLRRCGWTAGEIDLGSFAEAAAYCAELIDATDLNGNAVQIPRFQCNLVMRRRRSAADWIRGVRNGSLLYLGYSEAGLLQVRIEGTMARQHASKPAGSNATEQLNGGWPAYEFGDGGGLSGIARRENGASSVRLWRPGAADSPNRVGIEFQDSFNEYQQDSLSLVDADDAALTRQETTVTSTALGVANFHQAARVARLRIDKAVRGNLFIEFETSVKGVHLRAGDLITITYRKEGMTRKPFRVTRIAPAANFGRIAIEAQAHEDAWYSDSASGGTRVRGRLSGEPAPPRPLLGSEIDENGVERFGIVEEEADSGDGGSETWLAVSFTPPGAGAESALAIPKLSLTPAISPSGGTLPGGQVLYYAVTAVDASGGETEPSFAVRAPIPEGGSTNRVTIEGLSFAPGTASFRVYRGRGPRQLYGIASNVPPASSFADAGLTAILAAPPDPNFDHAIFEWRLELHPETAAGIFGESTIGAGSLTLTPGEYAGMIARITRGRGAGQERAIDTNSATALTIRGSWTVAPDATSHFTIVEPGWKAGATSSLSPVRFRIPNRPGATVQITGRAANATGRDSGYELAPVTRWRIGGAAGSMLDADVPAAPFFALQPAGKGNVDVVAVGFASLDNTRGVQSGTLRIFYVDELASPAGATLIGGIGAEETVLTVSSSAGVVPGGLLQTGAEVMEAVTVSAGTLTVLRGSHGTVAEAHSAGATVHALESRTYVIPFGRDFFGSPASGAFTHPIHAPAIRIAAAEMHVANSRGNSETGKANFTASTGFGVRTLSGGQLTMQVEGYLAIQNDATPPLIVDERLAVRDIFAVVGEAPTGAPVLLRLKVNGTEYCALTIAPDATVSNVVNGFGLAPLAALSELTLDIVSVSGAFMTSPGRDLTVTLRL